MHASQFFRFGPAPGRQPTGRPSAALPPITGVISLLGRRPRGDFNPPAGARPSISAAAAATRLPPLRRVHDSAGVVAAPLPPLRRTVSGGNTTKANATASQPGVVPPPSVPVSRARSATTPVAAQSAARATSGGNGTAALAATPPPSVLQSVRVAEAPSGAPSAALLAAAPTQEEMLAIVAGLKALHNLQARVQANARAAQKPRKTKKVRAAPPTAGSMADRGRQIPSAYSCIVNHEDDDAVTRLIASLRERGALLSEEVLAQGMKSVQHAPTSDKADSTTLVLYYAHVRRIVKVIGADGRPLLPTPWGYCEFLTRCVAQKVSCSHDTASRMRSALNWFWAYCGLDYSRYEGLMERNYRGYCASTPQEAAAVRGAISLSQLDELTSYLKATGHPEFVEPVEFQWAMALRGNQVGRATFGQVLKLDASSNFGSLYSFTGPRDKVTQGHKARQDCERHLCAPELNERLEAFIERRRSEAEAKAARTGEPVLNMLVFPDWRTTVVNEAIKGAARKYEWSDLLNYCGTHCLRHGSLADAFAKGGDEAAVRRGDQQAAETRIIYTKSHEERVATARARRDGKPAPKPAGKKAVTAVIRRRKGVRKAGKVETRGRPKKETSTKKKAQRKR
jgi:hypothetical protein